MAIISYSNLSVVLCSTTRILTHVRGDEHPLWQGVGSQITLEKGEVLDLGQTAGVRINRIVADKWAISLMLVTLKLISSHTSETYLCLRT